MIVMAFDLSSVCIGVIAVEIKKGKVANVRSCPIIPKSFDHTNLGYMKSKKKLPTKRSGEMINTYWKKGETVISKTEKQKRDREVRSHKDIFVLQDISKTINYLISNIKPDLVLVEKNEIFNGILTSVLLGKVMGTLVSITGIHNMPLIERKVSEVRSIFNLGQILRTFRDKHSDDELKAIPDITKRALREEMERIYGPYGIKFQTDDESDACVVFHYWFTTEYNEGENENYE